MQIQIVGPGSKKSQEFYDNAVKAVQELGLKAEVVKIEDPKKIREYHLISAPSLAIDGNVKTAGAILSADDIKRLLRRITLVQTAFQDPPERRR